MKSFKNLEELKLDIIILIETKKDIGLEIIDEFVHFYSGILKKQRVKRKVSIILKRKLIRSVIEWENIDENLIRVNLNWMQTKITIRGI